MAFSKQDFDRVFAYRKRLFMGYFIGYYSPGAIGGARLGIIISKKASKKAVTRNRIRRQVRESFRLVATKLPNMDIVVIARHTAGSATNEDLRQCLDKLWQRLLESPPK